MLLIGVYLCANIYICLVTLFLTLAIRFRFITFGLIWSLGWFSAVYGVSNAYMLHQYANIIAAWLVAIHFSTSGFSFANLSIIFEGDEGMESGISGEKKRP